ncbi:hypothetical protein Ddye_032029 [Dipteronia dyeriana]|uniref:Uncharacterized protein n=1 Tax=Dipteronia dyeriana TaxID=168575 RepID=A0AAD9TJI2_9ROSI|nr:hypothetical protein Ddye_032029 [Dipteronia dyeriana]
MEATYVYNTKTQNFSPIFPLNRIQNQLENLPPPSLRLRQRSNGGVAAIGCVALESSSSSSLSSSPASSSSLMESEAEEEWIKIGNLREKCKDQRKEMVELLVCLEREAIMGDDEGKEPTDYNRRAHIFDKSSKVFQALKDTNE